MQLGEAGESRVNGYLFVLRRSLRSFLPAEVADDAVKEVGSHIRDRLEEVEATADEREAVERVLAELGPPLRVARSYSTEMAIDEALTTGRFVAVARALWRLGTTSVVGFAWAMFVFTGWVLGASVMLLAPIKVLFPDNVGIFYRSGAIQSVGANFGRHPGVEVAPFGYWIVPVALVLGFGILVATQRASRRILGWMRSRRPGPRIRVRMEIERNA
jgi:uncharacterized membrane protein